MIELIDVSLRRGNFVLPKTSLTVPKGSFAGLTGSAGAGKTSIVEAICGLQPITTGQVKLRGNDASKLTATARGIGYLPQDLVLFPHMSVAENIGLGPKLQRHSKHRITARTNALASDLGLSDFLDRKPNQLSGGQQKRVALARAVALNPDILCLDEPMVSLDPHSRSLVVDMLRKIRETQTTTLLVVTHQPKWVAGVCDVEFKIAQLQR